MLDLYGRDILSLKKYSGDEIYKLVANAIEMKRNLKSTKRGKSSIGAARMRGVASSDSITIKPLEGKTIAMLFDKPSSRTRISFETASAHLGIHPIFLRPDEVQVGKREPIKDVGRVLSGYVDAIVIRTFEHSLVEELAEFAAVPVINALTDEHHPMQALADAMTIFEHKERLTGIKLAYVGDGNNVAHSLLIAGAKLGMDVSIGCPKGYEPNSDITEFAQDNAKNGKNGIVITNDPFEAVTDADVVYTDVWASMGQEAEAQDRAGIFAPYQVNNELMARAKETALFMHCLPAHRGEEVTDEIVESKQSVVFEQAENRMHTAKAVLAALIR
jgi:ornithine carbamoyltransferase